MRCGSSRGWRGRSSRRCRASTTRPGTGSRFRMRASRRTDSRNPRARGRMNRDAGGVLAAWAGAGRSDEVEAGFGLEGGWELTIGLRLVMLRAWIRPIGVRQYCFQDAPPSPGKCPEMGRIVPPSSAVTERPASAAPVGQRPAQLCRRHREVEVGAHRNAVLSRASMRNRHFAEHLRQESDRPSFCGAPGQVVRFAGRATDPLGHAGNRTRPLPVR